MIIPKVFGIYIVVYSTDNFVFSETVNNEQRFIKDDGRVGVCFSKNKGVKGFLSLSQGASLYEKNNVLETKKNF